MEEISIKLSISDRIYPLKVRAEEEEGIRHAAKLINEKIKEYQEFYQVKDRQDLLSMATLHYAIEDLKLQQKTLNEDEAISYKVNELDNLLNVFFAG
ncbi:MAG: cell division protein ZapA [Pedobacter sp.]|uniref:cell division protein ZapA n=1 Tax=Pedobacter sp. TaxID=1411316 RepID=UPI0035643BC4